MKTVIGLEIHVQLKTKSKMFCGCDNRSYAKASDGKFGSVPPNSLVCPVCMGMPGTLPVANRQAIDWTIMTGLAFGAKINPKSKFDRKHYFYPDLPKGYQISQYDEPFCRGGEIEIRNEKGKIRKIKLRRVHLEEDAGKLIHISGRHPEFVEGSPANAGFSDELRDSSPLAQNDTQGGYSLVDLNRAGTPLMEIVTEPDINSPKEAKLFLQKLRTILRHLGVSDSDMEKGHLRCDANISISQLVKKSDSQKEEWEEGTPVEIKNMNSFKMVERALSFEENRQREAIKDGEKIEKETRGWIDTKGMTVSQRSKEYAEDYRYFPEPDLPPFLISQNQISKIKDQISEDIDIISQRYQAIGIGQADVAVLTSNFTKKRYYDDLINKLATDDEKVLAAKWLVNRFFNKYFPVDQYAVFIKKLSAGEIPQAKALEVIRKSSEENKKIEDVISQLGLTRIDDSDKINNIVSKVLSENEKPAVDYRAGREQALKYLVGQVMAKSKGQADPQTAEKILKDKLK